MLHIPLLDSPRCCDPPILEPKKMPEVRSTSNVLDECKIQNYQLCDGHHLDCLTQLEELLTGEFIIYFAT